MKRSLIPPPPPPARIVNDSVDCREINFKNIRRWKMLSRLIMMINWDRSIYG